MLSDIVLEFLFASKKHNLISEDSLREIMDTKIGVQMVLCYIWGKFPVDSSLTNLYLNFDFKQSLEGSPFTQELMDFLECQSQKDSLDHLISHSNLISENLCFFKKKKKKTDLL
jgi:hypothetical protein